MKRAWFYLFFSPQLYSNLPNGQALGLHIREFENRIWFMVFNIYIVGYISTYDFHEWREMSFLLKDFIQSNDLPSNDGNLFFSFFSW